MEQASVKKERAGALYTPRLSCEGSRSQGYASCGHTSVQAPSKRQTDCVVIRRTSAAARESAVGCPVYLAASPSPWLGEWLAAWYGERVTQKSWRVVSVGDYKVVVGDNRGLSFPTTSGKKKMHTSDLLMCKGLGNRVLNAGHCKSLINHALKRYKLALT